MSLQLSLLGWDCIDAEVRVLYKSCSVVNFSKKGDNLNWRESLGDCLQLIHSGKFTEVLFMPFRFSAARLCHILYILYYFSFICKKERLNRSTYLIAKYSFGVLMHPVDMLGLRVDI